jgi:ubiquinone/menaquinone biosynthesis C-methylase UbiE
MEEQTSKEHPSTYFVEDRANIDELSRLRIQDTMLTRGMGGVLPEQDDPTLFHTILDVGCGTGNWIIEIAKTYPTAKTLVGVDVSAHFVQHAREQAAEVGVSDRVEFHVMDALRMLEFPSATFDLVNQRLGLSYLRTWEWNKLLQEYRRVTHTGGPIRVTESDVFAESSSRALTRFFELTCNAFYQSGHLFVPGHQGATGALPDLLQRQSIIDVQRRKIPITYTARDEWYKNDVRLLLRTIRPFLQKWTRLPDDYDALCQQILQEMEQPDFTTIWELVTIWGKSPDKKDGRPIT